MNSESDFKSAFKKSVHAQKGFSLSLAAPMIVGIPDLYVIINGFIPVLLEAKWLKDINQAKFKRKIEYSPMQKKWINDCNEVRRFSALGLVGVKYGKYLISAYIQEVSREDNYISNDTPQFVNYKDGQFDVIQLFEKIGVPKINPLLTNIWETDKVEFSKVHIPVTDKVFPIT